MAKQTRNKSQKHSRSRQQQKARTQRRGRSQGIGGYWATVLETAVVPLSLLGLQQSFRRKTNKKRH